LKSIAEQNRKSGQAAELSATAASLLEIWQKILGVPRITVHDDFFDLGGHSLLATRVIAKARTQLGKRLRMSDLFECPTVAQLANRVDMLPPSARR
jgi:acyl carrier protein